MHSGDKSPGKHAAEADCLVTAAVIVDEANRVTPAVLRVSSRFLLVDGGDADCLFSVTSDRVEVKHSNPIKTTKGILDIMGGHNKEPVQMQEGSSCT